MYFFANLCGRFANSCKLCAKYLHKKIIHSNKLGLRRGKRKVFPAAPLQFLNLWQNQNCVNYNFSGANSW